MQRETGLHWKTLKKILGHSESPGYRQRVPRAKKKLGPYLERIGQILKEDKALPKKQRHTAKRIWERLREEGYSGGYTAVKDAVRDLEQKNREVGIYAQTVAMASVLEALAHSLAKLSCSRRLRAVRFACRAVQCPVMS